MATLRLPSCQQAKRHFVRGRHIHLTQRLWQPKGDLAEGFTQHYGVATLVLEKGNDTMESAVAREKANKGGNLASKTALTERSNPQWLDLYEESK